IIQQTLTAGLLYSPERYFMFNYRSLYDYSVSEKVSMYSAMSDRLALGRNEFRTGMGLEPREDMEELIGLENYIPADLLGKQKKLKSEVEK
ncbi:MAG: phage portal protein, partial [Christensenellales bacterium]